MINYNNTKIIGVDMGYGNMKTAHTIFPTGLSAHETKPVFSGNILHFENMYYRIGEGHKPFIADKTSDRDFYILTVAAIGAECIANNCYEGDIFLALALPVSWVKAQREDMRSYVLQNDHLEFDYRERHFKLKITGCYVFPQGYPALVDKLDELGGVNMLADIGNGTINIMQIINKKVDESKCFTEKMGVNRYMIAAQNAVSDKFGKHIAPAIVEDFIRHGKADIPEEYTSCLNAEAEKYCTDVMNTLAKYEYEPDFMKLYIVGGGGRFLRRYLKYPPERVIIVGDACAAAKGFEKAAYMKLRQAAERGNANEKG